MNMEDAWIKLKKEYGLIYNYPQQEWNAKRMFKLGWESRDNSGKMIEKTFDELFDVGINIPNELWVKMEKYWIKTNGISLDKSVLILKDFLLAGGKIKDGE